jgi:hypothetical protein
MTLGNLGLGVMCVCKGNLTVTIATEIELRAVTYDGMGFVEMGLWLCYESMF